MDMFYIVFGDFLKDPLYFGFNSHDKISYFLRNSEFQKPFRCKTDPILLEDHFFHRKAQD
jgi:hypothetical protein